MNIPCIQTARVVPVFGRLRCKPVDVAYCQFNTLISYAQEAYLRVIPIQSKLLGSLESVLRRLRSISERSVCTCVCVCVFESVNMRCNTLVLFSKVLKNAASKAECGGCIVHYVLCVSTRMRNSFLCHDTKDRAQR